MAATVPGLAVAWAQRWPVASSFVAVFIAIGMAIFLALTEDCWSPDRVMIVAPRRHGWWPSRRQESSLATVDVDMEVIRLGVATTTKDPPHLLAWLNHYRTHLQVERFYLRVEAAPGLRPLLHESPWDALVSASFISSSPDAGDVAKLGQRQLLHVRSAIVAARADGLSHLLHVDDDELVYCPGGLGTLHAELHSYGGAASLRLRNAEMLMHSDEPHNPFEEGRAFVNSPRRFAAYVNGKAIGRLSAPGLAPADVHHFTSSAGPRAAVQHRVPAHVAVVLHYESCSFSSWRQKHAQMAAHYRAAGRAPDLASIGRFKQQSMLLATALHDAEEARAAAVSAAAVTGRSQAVAAARETAELAEAEAHAFWARYKREPADLLARASNAGRLPSALQWWDGYCGITLLPSPLIN